MSFLLDTHTGFINGDEGLPKNVIESITNINNKCYLSVASLWEMAIKMSIEKLSLKNDFNQILNFLSENDIEVLPVSFEHIQNLLHLDFHHRDPFDRLIIEQAIIENLTIISRDHQFKNYNVKVTW